MRRASSRKVTTIKKRPMAGRYLYTFQPSTARPIYPICVRLDRLRHRVQPIFNLACLLSDSIQGTRIVRCFGLHVAVVGADIEARLLWIVAEVVSGSASNLSHVDGLGVGHAAMELCEY